MVLVINRTVNTVQQQMDKYYDAVFIGIEEKIETTFIAWDSILIPKSRNRLLTNSLVDELGREQYLPSIFSELSETDFGTRVYFGLFDFELSPIKTDSRWFDEKEYLLEFSKLRTVVIEEGKIHRSFFHIMAEPYYLMAIPIFYQGNAEGALLIVFEWRPIWNQVLAYIPDTALNLLYKKKTVISSGQHVISGIYKDFTFPDWSDLQLTAHIPDEVIRAPAYELAQEIILISIFLIVLMVIINIAFLSDRIIRPIVDLQKALNMAGDGKWEKVSVSKGGKEVAGLARSFNQMIENLGKTQAEQIKAKEQAQAQAHLAEKMAMFAQAFPFPIMSINQEGNVETANLAADSAFQKLVNNRHLFELFPNLPVDFLDKMKKSGEIYFSHLSIGARYFMFTFQWIKQFNVIHVFGNDVSKLRQSEEKVHEKQLWEALYYRAGEILHEVGNKTLIMVGYSIDSKLVCKQAAIGIS